jgi:hypothetical protein
MIRTISYSITIALLEITHNNWNSDADALILLRVWYTYFSEIPLYILIFLSRYREFATIQIDMNLASFLFFHILINAQKIIETLLIRMIRPLLHYASLRDLFTPPTHSSMYLASPAPQTINFDCNTKHPEA